MIILHLEWKISCHTFNYFSFLFILCWIDFDSTQHHFRVFLERSSSADSPRTYTTALFFPQAHNGPQCSHCWVPIFSGGPLPTSLCIKWRRAARPCSLWATVVKHWVTLQCCPTYRPTPDLTRQRRLADIQTLSQERWWRVTARPECCLMRLVPRVRTRAGTGTRYPVLTAITPKLLQSNDSCSRFFLSQDLEKHIISMVLI